MEPRVLQAFCPFSLFSAFKAGGAGFALLQAGVVTGCRLALSASRAAPRPGCCRLSVGGAHCALAVGGFDIVPNVLAMSVNVLQAA